LPSKFEDSLSMSLHSRSISPVNEGDFYYLIYILVQNSLKWIVWKKRKIKLIIAHVFAIIDCFLII